MTAFFFLCCYCLVAAANGFYVPGVNHIKFQRGQDVPLKVNALTSVHTLIPVYASHGASFCEPRAGFKDASMNLGERLTGNMIQNSPYLIEMLEEVRCRKVCQVSLSSIGAAKLSKIIEQGYHSNWILDNLPSANVAVHNFAMQKHYAGGFPIGFFDSSEKQAYIFNHVNIIVDYHSREDEDEYSIVGFGVEPTSVRHHFPGGYQWDGVSIEGFGKDLETCPSQTMQSITQEQVDKVQIVKPGEDIIYTYDVTWNSISMTWASRWDVYLTGDHNVPPQVHWHSILNSLAVVIFLSTTVTCILVWKLRKDEAISGDADEGKGWKTLHGDVFRPPQTRPELFCAFVGTGVQLALTGFIVISGACWGWISPARRGSLLNAILLVYTCCSYIGGYTSCRLYKAIGGDNWKKCSELTATLFSGAGFCVLLFLGVLLSLHHSTARLLFLDLGMLVCAWIFLCVPMTIRGSQAGYQAKAVQFPTATTQSPRPIPPPTRLWKIPILSMILTGFLTFGAIYLEMFFIMTSLWMNQYYYVFGFTFIVYVVVLITCSEVTILAVYYRLNAENHEWWWQAFFWSGSIAFYMFGYSIIWYQILEAGTMLLTPLIYFGYMFLACFACFLGFGSVGFLASLCFVCRMYSVVNADQGDGYMELLNVSDDPVDPEEEDHDLLLTEGVESQVI